MSVNRRNFLKTGLYAAAGLGVGKSLFAAGRAGGAAAVTMGASAAPFAGALGAGAAATSGEKVLVVINLFGGNDGLSTLIPLIPAQYDRYRRLRKSLRFDQADLLTLNGQPDFGLNPAMSTVRGLFNQGKVAIINGVGVPESAAGLFDHETGQYEFQSCDIHRSVTNGPPTGWAGRYLDTVPQGAIPPGIDMGGGRLMVTGAQRQPISIQTLDQFQLQVTANDETARRNAYRSIMSLPVSDGTVSEQAREYRVSAVEQSEIIHAATDSYVPSVTYPDSYLGTQLKECAKIIYGNVGARTIAVGIGGFDTHSDQNRKVPQGGHHDRLLKDVSDSIGAFYSDLVTQHLSSRVLIMTISEFGRRAYENGDRGTDHGLSSVALALGDGVHGGIYGPYPDLNNLVLDGNLAKTTDFRSVFASALAGHFGADPVPLVGGSFPLIPFVG